MRDKGIDYFENCRRATHVQQRYAIDNPLKFKGYGANCWGITASDGPGPETSKIDGIERQFFNYVARGVPFGPDDGTLAPWAIVSSLPFAPGIVLPVIEHLIHKLHLNASNRYGFKATLNATYPVKSGNPHGWVSPWHFGIDQEPIVLMIENYRSELLWRLTRQSPLRSVTIESRAGQREGIFVMQPAKDRFGSDGIRFSAAMAPYPSGWRASVREAIRLPHFPIVLHRGGYPDGS
jgi:hypothetical protein